MAITIAEALARTEAALASFPSPETDAYELVSRLLGVERLMVHLKGREAMADGDWERLDGWIRRRLAGEPIQYITGRADFSGFDLKVTPAVLIPRPETEGMVVAVLELLKKKREAWPRPRVLDLGTGSGAIAIVIAADAPRAVVTATDASEAALEVARANAAEQKLAARIRFLQGDWFDAIDADEMFEVVVANPPYIATGEWDALPHDVRAFEPAEALFSGPSGLEALREIVDEAPRHLVAGGLLALEMAEARAAEVAAWLEGAHDWESSEVRDDLAGRPRVLLARRAHGPAIAPRQWPEER
jgi:release factor glutamine methyltransferase